MIGGPQGYIVIDSLDTLPLGTHLGEGTFSTVALLDLPGAPSLVVKMLKHIPGFDSPQLQARNEAEYLHQVATVEGVPKIFALVVNPPCIIMSMAKGILFHHFTISRPVMKDMLRVCIKVCYILQNIHNLGYVHNDLKFDNILIDPGSLEVTIIDLGLLAKVGTIKFPIPFDMDKALKDREKLCPSVCPELYVGGPCHPSVDVYSVAYMIEKAVSWCKPVKEALDPTIIRCQGPSASRPSISELAAAMELILS
ncbi:hypothetical protein Pmani_023933 [Petrolisthes manimaculis]|uniref:Protein kinase domain-containing protein n=1 Tax=Petrolisthes manimaculis TaxID=1843537 RepID=A0AAE1NKP2_9EUCA|nr:hypothetical protein Pmani_035510 [Petrolisthes manimaculis]KAK4304108.1 hypothetical protein Pmani_023933 [Petrolisthes manimaculis]